jgi:hypothetical protein
MARYGPNFDYDHLYGSTSCIGCKYYRPSGKIEGRMRCAALQNTTQGKLGTLYFKRPDFKNHLGRCQDYEEADKQPTTV